jgi:hypothetical protein
VTAFLSACEVDSLAEICVPLIAVISEHVLVPALVAVCDDIAHLGLDFCWTLKSSLSFRRFYSV